MGGLEKPGLEVDGIILRDPKESTSLHFLHEETKAWGNNKALLVSGKPGIQT